MVSTTATPIDLEEAIVKRLEDTLKKDGIIKYVYDTREYAGVREQSQLVPAIAVIYNGYRAGDTDRHGRVQAVLVQFLTVIVTRSSKQTLRSTGAKQEASVIFDALMEALTGWKPKPGTKRLTLEDAPGAGYSDAGMTYLPVAFSTRITYTATT